MSGTVLVVNVVSIADLSLVLTVDKRTLLVNEVITITGQVNNGGPQLATGVQVVSRLPPNMSFVGSSQTGVTSSGGAVSMAIGTLPVGSSGTFSFRALVTQPGTYRTAAEITASTSLDPDSYLNSGTADGDDDAATVDLRTREPGSAEFNSPNPNPRYLPPVQGNQPVPGVAEADLSLQLKVSNRSLAGGAPVSLSVLVANRGSLTATGTTIAITLPSGWLVTNTMGLTVNGQVVTLTLASLAANQATTITVPVQVGGSGEQQIRCLITGAGQPDLDSSHTNGYGLGEDDEATVSVRVR